ncbi:unnamed protein product [Vitrella brassicaformis CCMP3155]|uniref:Uncharacterized protein n=1 Tax=Vitrella brassicaformis (strain CCMP3155) TaxID=1169540 RepID=A0A0G4EW65_VITBC|nr:unnamed protein product [Vitrella brassicaformis CCMP3155]|eukprot:CEM02698.1 unnamed protein product [Vitrella brassicaformis CCMP3155]
MSYKYRSDYFLPGVDDFKLDDLRVDRRGVAKIGERHYNLSRLQEKLWKTSYQDIGDYHFMPPKNRQHFLTSAMDQQGYDRDHPHWSKDPIPPPRPRSSLMMDIGPGSRYAGSDRWEATSWDYGRDFLHGTQRSPDGTRCGLPIYGTRKTDESGDLLARMSSYRKSSLGAVGYEGRGGVGVGVGGCSEADYFRTGADYPSSSPYHHGHGAGAGCGGCSHYKRDCVGKAYEW